MEDDALRDIKGFSTSGSSLHRIHLHELISTSVNPPISETLSNSKRAQRVGHIFEKHLSFDCEDNAFSSNQLSYRLSDHSNDNLAS